ncbi:hypothetical protein [Nocardioides sp. GXQ0305]|uniref:hypothetical protein n=1 Tax=Nocardioides sp. GXQ0305 TaxID=3423912 RepID=UPI003D7C78A5
MTGVRPDRPAPLTVAASLVAVEGVVVVVLALVEIFSLTSTRLTMGLTTTAFFAAYGALLVGCGLLLVRRVSWARGPAVLAQLIQLGLAWSFRGSPTTLVAIALAVVAAVVLAGIFHPASIDALAEE